jgi:5-methylcytosine-specific restriction endonuclease McrA
MSRKKSKKSLLKEKCERLMFELATLLYGKKCEVCGKSSKLLVHHFIPREKCKALIYNPLNLIILCSSCHFDLHIRQNSLIAGKIVEKRGISWLKKLNEIYEKVKKEKRKSEIRWLEQQSQFLEEEIKKARQSQEKIDGL